MAVQEAFHGAGVGGRHLSRRVILVALVFMVCSWAADGQTQPITKLDLTTFVLNGQAILQQSPPQVPRPGPTLAFGTLFNQTGSAYTPQVVSLATNSSGPIAFSVEFTFVGLKDGQSDGFTFVIQNNDVHEVGQPGFFLGYGRAPNLTSSVAVEFRTYNGSCMAVDTGGVTAGYTCTGGYTLPPGTRFADGVEKKAWIQYDASQGSALSVYLAMDTTLPKPLNPVLSKVVTLKSILGATSAYLGFTGATGGGSPETTWITNCFFQLGHSTCGIY